MLMTTFNTFFDRATVLNGLIFDRVYGSWTLSSLLWTLDGTYYSNIIVLINHMQLLLYYRYCKLQVIK